MGGMRCPRGSESLDNVLGYRPVTPAFRDCLGAMPSPPPPPPPQRVGPVIGAVPISRLTLHCVRSLTNKPLRELSNPGASGSLFYLSHDDQCVSCHPPLCPPPIPFLFVSVF